MDTAKFPYYVNHGMEFLRVQDQRNMIVSIWQKEDGKEYFTQKSFVNNGMRIMVKGDRVTCQGDAVEKEMSNGRIESIIQWDKDWMKEIVEKSDPNYIGKTYRVYVSDDSIKTICYDGEYDSNKRYVYTEWDEKGNLKSRGLISGDLRKVYPFKEFKDGIMTEYEYDYCVKSGAIDRETKKEIYRGKYVNSMKRGYPRDDNPRKVQYDGPNQRTSRESPNRGSASPIYQSYRNQENEVGERVDEGKKEGGNDSHGSDDTTVSVVTHYSSITAIEDISLNCEYICLQKCPDCYGDLNFSELNGLVSVVIDDDSLNNALFIKFASMSQLESITIGAGSFTTSGGLSIEHCAKLESLKIGPYSFNSATSFIVMNCQNLKSITVGSDTKYSYNFWSCDELVLSSE